MQGVVVKKSEIFVSGYSALTDSDHSFCRFIGSGGVPASREYHALELWILSAEDQTAQVVLANGGACWYLLGLNRDRWEEVEGPFHGIDYFPELLLLQGWVGDGNHATVIDPFAK